MINKYTCISLSFLNSLQESKKKEYLLTHLLRKIENFERKSEVAKIQKILGTMGVYDKAGFKKLIKKTYCTCLIIPVPRKSYLIGDV